MHPFEMNARQFCLVFRFELIRKTLSWRFLSSLIVMVAVFAVSYLASSGGPTSTDPVVRMASPFLMSAAVVIAFAAVVLSSEDISSEYDRKTAYVMLTKPVSRYTFTMGKMVSGLLLSVIIIAIYYAASATLFISEAGSLPSNMHISFGLAVLYAVACTGVAMLIGTVARRNSVALVLFMFVLVVLVLLMQGSISSIIPFEPWMSLSYSSGSIYYCTTGLHTVYDAYGATDIFIPEMLTSAVVMAGYFVISTALMLVIFRFRNWI